METGTNPFQGKVRLRACGLLLENQKILLVKHRKLGRHGYFWSPPGGGVEFGESIQEAVVREFREEAGLVVQSKGFAGYHEHMDPRFHAIELFFFVSRVSGEISLGTEPEGNESGPVLEDLGWFSHEHLSHLPEGSFHSICLPVLQKQYLF
jgi:8-oxo-dGTP diphosphatase